MLTSLSLSSLQISLRERTGKMGFIRWGHALLATVVLVNLWLASTNSTTPSSWTALSGNVDDCCCPIEAVEQHIDAIHDNLLSLTVCSHLA